LYNLPSIIGGQKASEPDGGQRTKTSNTIKTPAAELPVNRYLATWILLKRVNDALIKVRNRELRQYDINLEYKATLHAVRRLGERATPGEIARLRCRRPHTISQVLKNMEKEGLVTKHPDTTRKNVIRITLTREGEKLSPKTLGTDTVGKIFSSLSPKEKLRLQMYLGVLYSEAVNKFAGDFKVMFPRQDQDDEPEVDIQRIARRAGEILVEVTAAINSAGADKPRSDIPGDALVRVALKSSTFLPGRLRQLSEYLEILRHASPGIDSGRQLPARKYGEGELEAALWRKLRRTHDVLVRISDREMASHGFSAKLASVLLAIKALGNRATSSEIARWRLRNASTMSSFLKRLEKQGLVRKLNSPRKSQHNRMSLTEKGEEYFKQAIAAESIVQIFQVFTPEELAELGVSLETIRERAIEELAQLSPGSV